MKPGRATIYARLSQDRSGDSLGITRQLELCRAKAAELGWVVAAEHVDRDISAYSRKRRPGWERLLADLQSGAIDGVVAVDQDRLARRLSELGRFIDICEKTGALLVLLSGEVDLTTADGRLRAHILGAVSENES